MNRKASETDWQRIETMPDEDIDLSDIPEITEKQMAKARVRIGGRPVPEGNAGARIGILVDADIVAYFKMKVGEKNYESVMNEMLRSGIRNDSDINKIGEGGPGNRTLAALR